MRHDDDTRRGTTHVNPNEREGEIMSNVRRALQMTLFMSMAYGVSREDEVKADAYCDGYIQGCYASLATWCEDTWYAGCSDTNHNIRHCDCGS